MQYFVYGPSGAGKNTEAFDTFMIPAFLSQKDGAGRDVFGNIGIDREKLEEVLGFKVRYHFIGRDEIRDPANWPALGDPGEDGRRTVSPGKLFTNGCMIIVDEARTVWRKNEHVDPRILDSLDTQRHFSTAEGYGIDVIWIGLTKRQFHGDIRENAEAYYKISPVEELRIRDAHRLTIFSEFRCGKEDVVGTPSKIVHHNKGYYGLYYSVEQGVAARHVLDERIRHSRFRPKHYLMFMGGTALAAIAGLIYFVMYMSSTLQSPGIVPGARVDKIVGGRDVAEVEGCLDPVLSVGGRSYTVDADGKSEEVRAYDGGCRNRALSTAASSVEADAAGKGFLGGLAPAGRQDRP